MFRLIKNNGEIIETDNGDYLEFLNDSWGGMFPFKNPYTGRIETVWNGKGSFLGAIRNDAYWEGEIKNSKGRRHK